MEQLVDIASIIGVILLAFLAGMAFERWLGVRDK